MLVDKITLGITLGISDYIYKGSLSAQFTCTANENAKSSGYQSSSRQPACLWPLEVRRRPEVQALASGPLEIRAHHCQERVACYFALSIA